MIKTNGVADTVDDLVAELLLQQESTLKLVDTLHSEGEGLRELDVLLRNTLDVSDAQLDQKPAKKRKGGNYSRLKPDEATLRIVAGLGREQATIREAGAVLGVSHQVFLNFLNRHQDARAVWENGKLAGRVSLRRRQWDAAMASDHTMLIWLGKQYLDQSDRSRQEVSGPDGGGIEIEDSRKRLLELLLREADKLGGTETDGTA